MATAKTKKNAPKKAATKKATPKKPVTGKAIAKKTVAKKPVTGKAATKKAATKKATPKKPVTGKATAKKTVAKKTVAKKPATKKVAPKKPVTGKAVAKKASAKKTTQKKTKKAPVMTPELERILSEPIYQATPVSKSKKFTKEITDILMAEKNKILQEVSEQIRSETKDSKSDKGDIYDIASVERERELSLTFGDRERNKLQNVEEALQRLKEGIYGECDECGESIGEQRLRALPFTCVCVECKSKEEKGILLRGKPDEFAGSGMLEKSEGEDL